MRPVFPHFGIGRSKNINPHSRKCARVFRDVSLSVNHQNFIESEIMRVDCASRRFPIRFGIMTNRVRCRDPTVREIVGSVGIFDISTFLRTISRYEANADIFRFDCVVINIDSIDRVQNAISSFRLNLLYRFRFCRSDLKGFVFGSGFPIDSV